MEHPRRFWPLVRFNRREAHVRAMGHAEYVRLRIWPIYRANIAAGHMKPGAMHRLVRLHERALSDARHERTRGDCYWPRLP